MIPFILPAVLFYLVISQETLPKPFQFRCYDNDVCTWPRQYCSSELHERRCIPCLVSVCQLPSPPHQCLYNCSLNEETKSDVKTPNKHKKEEDYSHIPLAIMSTFCVILLVGLACLALFICKLKEKVKTKEDKIEEMESLIKVSGATEGASIEHKDERSRTESTNTTDSCYIEKKLKHVTPTKDSSSPDEYKPTTYMDAPSASN